MRIFVMADFHGDLLHVDRAGDLIRDADMVVLAGDLSGSGDRGSAESSIHSRGVIAGGIGFFGLGGSRRTPMHTFTEYNEEQIAEFLRLGYSMVEKSGTRVLVSHTPPKKCRDRTFFGLSAGSPALREFMESNPFDLCLCGHIHEAYGADRSCGVLVVNSGSFRKGRYSSVEIGGGIKVESGRV
ncbi:MAG: metallophosphoesterase family protein [Spirochaetes bacterium]|nr:metallophosphoesterase family protein [Spirochaetota bacterium]